MLYRCVGGSDEDAQCGIFVVIEKECEEGYDEAPLLKGYPELNGYSTNRGAVMTKLVRIIEVCSTFIQKVHGCKATTCTLSRKKDRGE